jgi:hypothetical protein
MRRPFLQRVWRLMEGSLNALPLRCPEQSARTNYRAYDKSHEKQRRSYER